MDAIQEGERYGGFYAICANLKDMGINGIVWINEKHWEAEECFRFMRTNFNARSVYPQMEGHIHPHFLTCFITLVIYRVLEKRFHEEYTCEEIIDTLKIW